MFTVNGWCAFNSRLTLVVFAAIKRAVSSETVNGEKPVLFFPCTLNYVKTAQRTLSKTPQSVLLNRSLLLR